MNNFFIRFVLLLLMSLLVLGPVAAQTTSGDAVVPTTKKAKSGKKKSKKSKAGKTKVAKTSAAGMDDITDQGDVSQQADQSKSKKK